LRRFVTQSNKVAEASRDPNDPDFQGLV
jgi:hypothetical protein